MPDPEKPGDFGDPVADSIRQEQNRDAMPSQEEARQEHRRYLSSEGCRYCGEEDPDTLSTMYYPQPSCDAIQKRVREMVVCEDCTDKVPTVKENVMDSVDESEEDAVVIYDCGNHSTGTTGEAELDSYQPSPGGPPNNIVVNLVCRCGALAEDIIYLNGGKSIEEIGNDN